MNTQIYQISQVPTDETIQENPSVNPPEKDPLIAGALEHFIYIGAFVLIIGIITLIGFLSNRLEYALIFALILSFLLIAVLLTL